MKNYAQTMEEKNKFIKKYTIYDMVGERYEYESEKKIYITLGNGKTHIIPYSEENELLVQARMKRQIREYIKAYKIVEEQTNMSFYELKNIKETIPFVPFSQEYIDKLKKKEEIINKMSNIFLISTLTIGLTSLFFIKNIASILIKLNIPVYFLTIPLTIYPLVTSLIILKHYELKKDLDKGNN